LFCHFLKEAGRRLLLIELVIAAFIWKLPVPVDAKSIRIGQRSEASRLRLLEILPIRRSNAKLRQEVAVIRKVRRNYQARPAGVLLPVNVYIENDVARMG
jgi:hypothetical protein